MCTMASFGSEAVSLRVGPHHLASANPSARQGLQSLLRRATCALRREYLLRLLSIPGDGLDDQVDEGARLEGQMLAAGIEQIQRRFPQAEFRQDRPQHIDEGRIVEHPCRQ